VRKANLFPPRAEELAVEGGKQPCFHFGFITQLVALGGPDAKRLLGKITGIGLVARQTEGKLVQRLVMAGYQAFKVHAVSHIAASRLRVVNVPIVPALWPLYNAFLVR